MKIYDPWATGCRIKAIVGHYGSGKTELALNMALATRAAGKKEVTLVDMDIVNPFFRSAEQSDLLSEQGIEIIYPPYAKTGVDIPVLSADILSVFERPERCVILDVGGDDAGATALGRYKPYFDMHGCDMLYVVNLYRPFSGTVDEICSMLERISVRSRLRPSGLINNGNLGEFTQSEHILECQRTLSEVSDRTGIPIVAASGEVNALKTLPSMDTPLFPIRRLTRPEWMES